MPVVLPGIPDIIPERPKNEHIGRDKNIQPQKESTDGFLNDLIQKTKSPYQSSRPVIEPDDFFGRKVEFEIVYQMLLSGESINLLGFRRIGKTSFLRIIHSPTIQKRILGGNVFDEHYVFAFVDMQSQKAATPIQFFNKLTRSIRESGLLDVNTDIQSYDEFDIELERYANKNIRFIFMFDEFDSVAQNKNFDIQFYDNMRYFTQAYPVSFVAASSKSIKYISKAEVMSSPFFNIFRYIRLGLLQENEANNLICKVSSLAPYVHVVKIIAGQHPFFISLLCYHLFYFQQQFPAAPPQEVIQKALESFLQEAFEHFVYYWGHITNDERAVLKKIADGEKIDEDDTPELISLEQKVYSAI